ncbi:Fic family protein [Streptomyces sp. NPDC001500]
MSSGALCEWRGWLESLAGWFDAYPLNLAAVEDHRILWERAARNLILQVADRTGCGSGWHGHCRQVLTWFLNHWQVAPDVAAYLVGEATGGRFLSLTGPDTVLVDDVAERLAVSLRSDAATRSAEPVPDHLERWLAVREAVPWEKEPDDGPDGPVVPSRDGAAEDIRLFDGAVDPARAQGLLAALELLRADAARRRPARFRAAPRLAAARPSHSTAAGVPQLARLDACLAESARGCGRSLPLAARAARAYLDVCFFHPFDDGNARSAFLTLLFVLAREGVALNDVGLLRRITFQATDPQDALILARYVEAHLAQTRRSAACPGC